MTLLSDNGDLITPMLQAPPEENKLPDKEQEVTLELRPVTEEAMVLEQLQHIVCPYSEDLFGDSPMEQYPAELVSEQVPEPGKFLLPCLFLLVYDREGFPAYESIKLLIQPRISVHFNQNGTHAVPLRVHPPPSPLPHWSQNGHSKRRKNYTTSYEIFTSYSLIGVCIWVGAPQFTASQTPPM